MNPETLAGWGEEPEDDGRDLPDGAFAFPASAVERERVQWLWEGRIPLGSVTLLAGREGLGKSMLTAELAGRLSRGEIGGEPAASLIATAEDSLAHTVRPRLEAVGADLDQTQFLRMRSDGVEGDISLPDDLDEMRRIVAEIGARLVVIDPLMAHLTGRVDSYRDQDIRRVLAPLYHLAAEHECAVVAVLHLNKTPGSDPSMRIGGSVGLPAAARSVLLLARDPDDPDPERGSFRVLAHAKCNLAPLAESLLYKIVPVFLPAGDSGPDVETARLECLGVSELSATSLLATPEPLSLLDEAAAWLEKHLADGAKEAGAVKQAAAAADIAARTLERAAKELDVVRKQTGVGKPWLWSLAVSPRGGPPPGETGDGETDDAASRQERGETGEARHDAGPCPSGHPSRQELARRPATAVSPRAPLPPPVGETGPLPGDDEYLPRLFAAFEADLVTEGEWHQGDRAHRRVVSARERRPA